MPPDGGDERGPDLSQDGVPLSDLTEGGMVAGHVGDEPVLIVRRGADCYALGATCTHYGGPLAEGAFDGDSVRCPWHHACFDVRTGAAVRAPALDGVPSYAVEQRGGRVYVTGRREPAGEPRSGGATAEAGPESVMVLGAGAAGAAAVEMLRREGYSGPVALVGAEDAVPYDRPNLSKDYLAGNAPEEWVPLRSQQFYAERDIELLLGWQAVALAPGARRVTFAGGESRTYGALLLATGAEPVRLQVPGNELAHVHYLRSLDDSRAIIADAERAQRAVVVGASFIGMEVAASLRARELEVHVVAPDSLPMEKQLGPELGRFVRSIHEEHGVRFHLGRKAVAIAGDAVQLDDGTRIEADLVVVGIGVRPRVELAERAGLTLDNGVLVDEYLQTSAPGVWAAGDIARWPDPHSGQRIRVEHWVVAERQGQTAARNILGRRERFDFVPFFWSQHYDVSINYVGHAAQWDRIDVEGNAGDRDVVMAFRKDGKTLAVASIFRDAQSLAAELAMERDDEAALQSLVPSSR